ncbi:MAG: Cell wall assembly/cell proliferation coordinating protein KNR4-like protein [Bacteroidota bacterium]|nr:Cell wall assembly/cell proliferation coordinating protein KNR4-like protein [Bacteroidota bacterium]
MRHLTDKLHDKISKLKDEGWHLSRERKYAKADDKFKEAIALIPEPKTEYNYLGLLWSEMAENFKFKKDFNAALTVYEQIMELPGYGDDAHYLVEIAKIRYELGQMDKVKKDLIEAYKLEGKSAFRYVDAKYYQLIKATVEDEKWSKENATNCWTDLENWIKTNVPDLSGSFNKGATDKDFQKLEKLTGVKLSDDFKLYYAIHNGQKDGFAGITFCGPLLSINNIIDQWTIWKKLLDKGDFKGRFSSPDQGVKKNWWNPLWIPFTYDGSGNHLCIDMDPASKGIKGQVITMWHDDDTREVIEQSFSEWFIDYLTDLKHGTYVYDKESGTFHRKES